MKILLGAVIMISLSACQNMCIKKEREKDLNESNRVDSYQTERIPIARKMRYKGIGNGMRFVPRGRSRCCISLSFFHKISVKGMPVVKRA